MTKLDHVTQARVTAMTPLQVASNEAPGFLQRASRDLCDNDSAIATLEVAVQRRQQ